MTACQKTKIKLIMVLTFFFIYICPNISLAATLKAPINIERLEYPQNEVLVKYKNSNKTRLLAKPEYHSKIKYRKTVAPGVDVLRFDVRDDINNIISQLKKKQRCGNR